MSKIIIFSFNGETIEGREGETIAAALIGRGQRVLRETRFNRAPRSIFCGIGVCFDCVVTVDGVSNQRSCLIEISEGMKVEGIS